MPSNEAAGAALAFGLHDLVFPGLAAFVAVALGAGPVVAFDLGDTFRLFEVGEGFFRPGVAVLFVAFGQGEEVGVLLEEPDPFDFLLVEAEEAA